MKNTNGNVILMLAPNEYAYQQMSSIPPLALGVLKGYLTEEEISTEIYDLNQTLHKRMNELTMNKWSFIYDSKRVLSYLHGEKDPEIENVLIELVSGIDLTGYDLVGVSLGADFSWLEMHGGMLLAKWIHDKYQVQVEIGGNNLHYLLQFKNDFKDLWDAIANMGVYICVGPGEKLLAKLVKMIRNGGIDDEVFRSLPGAVWRDGEEVKSNPQDIPSLTMPDFTGLDLSPYKICIRAVDTKEAQSLNEVHVLKWPQPYPLMASSVNRATLSDGEKKEVLVIPYIFNYNCPFHCAFCVQSGEDKKKIVVKPTEVILDEIEALMQKYESNFFYFYNNTFNYTPKFVREFCEGIQRRGIKIYWSDCARFNNLNKELVNMLYEAGCRKLVFGFETGSDKLLQLFDKQLNLEHAENVLQWCKDAGIWADIEVIIGLPYEFEEDYKETEAFIRKNRNLINHFAMNRYFVVPDSLIGRHPERYGIKLVRVKKRYDALLNMNYQCFVEGKQVRSGASNFQVYRYSELDGRSHSEIVAHTNDKLKRLVNTYLELPIAQETRVMEWKASKIQ